MRKLSFTIVLMIMLSSVQVMAQGLISYGGAVVSALSPEAPIAIFTFQGSQGDQVTLQAIGITPELDLSASIQSGTAILATADGDPFTTGSTDARIDVLLPSTGVYLVLISSPTGQAGDFLLKLSGQALAEKTIITGIPADVSIVAGATSYYSFTGSPDGTTVFNLTALSPDLQFLAVVRNDQGQIVGTSSGASTIVSVTGQGSYEISLSGVTSAMAGVVHVSLGSNTTPPIEQPQQPVATQDTTTTDAPPPVVTEEVTGDTQANDPNGACVVSSDGFVNIRSGPTTNDNIIAQMQPGQTYTVTGYYVDWYQVNVPETGTGWVFSGVVTTGGNCSAIPAVSPPTTNNPPPATAVPDNNNPPVEQATPTYTPSYTPTTAVQQQQATPTFTPSYTPTEPVVQLAPDDARFNNDLNIPLDGTVSVLDFVSYPDGDTEDRVRWDITGMNATSTSSGGQARLVISVSCFGQNTDQIEFFTGGQTYSCGQTIVDSDVTFNSKTGSVVITAIGGTGTYVQWVLTGTATRSN
jgi:hypothetical protein